MGTANPGLFTSTTDEWSTPAEFFALLDEEFHFTLDACASPDNAKCDRYFTKDDNGLTQTWEGTVWMNPPYGRDLRLWVEKAYREATNGAVVVALLPARTDTSYWHNYVMRAAEIRLVRGRIHFANPHHTERVANGVSTGHQTPFPSAVAVFRPGHHHPQVSSMWRDVGLLDQARQKSKWKPAPPPSERRVQEPEPEEEPT